MSEIILDSVIDSIKLLPFLFLTYLFMEWLEHKISPVCQCGSTKENPYSRKIRTGMGWTSGSDPTVWIFGSGIQPFCRTCDHSGNFDRGVSVYFR